MYWSRWSSSAAVAASVPPLARSWLLIAAICFSALLAAMMDSLMPVSALARRLWMPAVVALSCWAIDCAALTTPMRADGESGLVDRPCSAVNRLLNAYSIVPLSSGLP